MYSDNSTWRLLTVLFVLGHTEITTGSSAIWDGRTLYSGNVYLSVPTVYAADNCRKIGSQQTNVLMTLASTHVYSYQYPYDVYPINWADFNTPYPWR